MSVNLFPSCFIRLASWKKWSATLSLPLWLLLPPSLLLWWLELLLLYSGRLRRLFELLLWLGVTGIVLIAEVEGWWWWSDVLLDVDPFGDNNLEEFDCFDGDGVVTDFPVFLELSDELLDVKFAWDAVLSFLLLDELVKALMLGLVPLLLPCFLAFPLSTGPLWSLSSCSLSLSLLSPLSSMLSSPLLLLLLLLLQPLLLHSDGDAGIAVLSFSLSWHGCFASSMEEIGLSLSEVLVLLVATEDSVEGELLWLWSLLTKDKLFTDSFLEIFGNWLSSFFEICPSVFIIFGLGRLMS